MTLYYTIVFGILASEVILFFLLALPIPARWKKPVFRWLATSPTVAHFQYIMKVVFAFVFILFVDSVNTIRAYYDVLSTQEDSGVPMGNTDFRSDVSQAAKKFYAQRNMYLTGFTLLLLLILNKLKNMNLDYIQLEDEAIQLRGLVTDDPEEKRASLEADTEPISDTVTTLEPVQRSSEEKESRPVELQEDILIKDKVENVPQARNRKPFESEKLE
ncbi:B-cell receptor-associated 31-like protein [Backusella circina FSU 941]|nr:B-cell receptor-associated 31-like protein [Backusella circina FSU 941]